MNDTVSTVFDSEFDAWRSTHPHLWLATTDGQTAAAFISHQTERITRAQLEAADRIVVSQQRVEAGVDAVATAVEKVADGVEGLASAFEFGFSEMVWQLEQQRETLKQILEVLRAPLDTQAKELRRRAEDAYRNGWIDDALTDFLDSEMKNPYDFTVHHYLGNIYLYQKAAPDKALGYYRKAAKYATPKSPYHAGIALLHVAEIEYIGGDFEEAYEATTRAVELSPDLGELYFARARYCARLRRYDEAIENLGDAIKKDRNYCLKAGANTDFDGMKGELRSFLAHLRDQALDEAGEELGVSDSLMEYAHSYDLTNSDKFIRSQERHSIAKELIGRACLFDCLDAKNISWDVQDLILNAIESHVSARISIAYEENAAALEKLETQEGVWTVCVPIGTVVVLGVLALIGIVTEIRGFKEGSGVSLVLTVVLSPILIIVGCVLNGLVALVVGRAIGWPIFAVLRKCVQARYQSELARLNVSLSEVKAKRSELNWHYEKDSA